MNQDDIIRIAREAGLGKVLCHNSIDGDRICVEGADWHDEIERFAALAYAAGVAAEREACAKVCDDKHHAWRWDDKPDSASGPRDCAAAIRARGE